MAPASACKSDPGAAADAWRPSRPHDISLDRPARRTGRRSQSRAGRRSRGDHGHSAHAQKIGAAVVLRVGALAEAHERGPQQHAADLGAQADFAARRSSENIAAPAPRGPSTARCRQTRRPPRPGTRPSARHGPHSCRRSRARRRREQRVGLERPRLPFDASSPIESSPTCGASTPSTSEANSAPMMPNCARCSGLGSGLAPQSIRTQGAPSAGSGTAMPGRAMPLIRPMLDQGARRSSRRRARRDDPPGRGPRAPDDRPPPARSRSGPARGRGRLVGAPITSGASTISILPAPPACARPSSLPRAAARTARRAAARAALASSRSSRPRRRSRKRRAGRRPLRHGATGHRAACSRQANVRASFATAEVLDLAAAVVAAVPGRRGAGAPVCGTGGNPTAPAPRSPCLRPALVAACLGRLLLGYGHGRGTIPRPLPSSRSFAQRGSDSSSPQS